MNIKEQEELLNLLNHKITIMSYKICRFPNKLFKKYYNKELNKVIDKRNQVFIKLREDTREKYPERFSTQEALK